MTDEPVFRTIGDLYDRMAKAKSHRDMREVYTAEVAFQQRGRQSDPYEVARANMTYVAGYGPDDERKRISEMVATVHREAERERLSVPAWRR